MFIVRLVVLVFMAIVMFAIFVGRLFETMFNSFRNKKTVNEKSGE